MKKGWIMVLVRFMVWKPVGAMHGVDLKHTEAAIN